MTCDQGCSVILDLLGTTLPPPDYVVSLPARMARGAWFGGPAARGLIVAAVGAAAAAGVLVATARARRRRHVAAARSLARALGVGGARQWFLLNRLARAAGLPGAGGMLLSEGCFDHAATAYTRRFGASPAVDRLRNRLFDVPSAGREGGSVAPGRVWASCERAPDRS